MPPQQPATASTRVAVWRQLLAQLVHFFALMLWVAGGLAFLAGLPQLGVAIFVVVVINAAFSFAQEFRAEQAANRLRELLPRKVRVRRDGAPRTIDASELVLDDVVELESGDRVCADLDALITHQLRVDTSTLTGESEPIDVESGGRLLAGTYVVEGDAIARVVATGSNTRLASISHLATTGARPKSPLQHELERIVKVIAAIAVLTGVLFFGLALLFGTPASDGFLFAIGVTVALVPEGLLPTVTLALAVGAQRMSQRHALVRHLESVETLGSTTFICTDKTGTLTRNEMSVVEAWTPRGSVRVAGDGYDPAGAIEGNDQARSAATTLAANALRCSTGRTVEVDGRWIAHGDPMEAAIDAFAGGSRRQGAKAPPRPELAAVRIRPAAPADDRRRRR